MTAPRSSWFRSLLCILPVACLATGATTAAQGVMPVAPEVFARDAEGQITVRAVQLTEPLVFDGRLDDEVYRSVPGITDFTQQEPNEGAPVSEKTETWIFFDDENIYVAARCWESHPDRMIVSEMRRDNQGIFNNEHFTAVFDTFYDRRTGYLFQTNPLGARRDQQVNDERSSNMDWNPVWDAKAQMFEGGWTLEMAIPFKSIRYKAAGPQVWGINLRRAIRYKNEWSYLSPVPVSYGPRGMFKFSSAATLVGVVVPKARNLELKPYAISSVTGAAAAGRLSDDLSGDAGFDVKYGLTRGLIADFTVNTDFAQVEADEQQVNLTRFNLFFPEKREFFLEGQGIFGFGGDGLAPSVFFSRQIGLNAGREVPIAAGARLTGRAGAYTLGLLNIQTKDAPEAGTLATNFTAVRVKRDILRRSSIGAIATHRDRRVRGSGTNRVVGVDADLAFFDNVFINSYYARSETPDTPGDPSSYQARAGYGGDRYGFEVEHLFVGDAFKPEIGFMRRHSFRRSWGLLRFSLRLRPGGAIRKLHWIANFGYISNLDGRLETREAEGSFQIEFNNGDRWSTEYTRSYELLEPGFRIAPNVTIPTGSYGFQFVRTSFNFGPQRPMSGNLSFQRGEFYDGTRTQGGYNGRIDVSSQLSVEPRVSFNWVDLP